MKNRKQKRRPLKASLFLLLFVQLSFAAPYELVKKNPLFNGETIHEYKLPNGLQVLLVPRHQAKVLTYQIWFRVGSVHEKLDPKLRKTGLAHLFEHMMFRGTPRFPDGQFDQKISRMGGTGLNATTYYYRTNYFESVPSDKLEEVMDLETDRMQNLQLIKDLFDKEKGAVVGELRRHLDNPGRIAYDKLARLIFNRATYRYTVIGTEKEIRGFTLKEAQYFYKTYYAPNNATVIIIGDIETKKTMDMIAKYYGPIKAQKIPERKVPVERPQKSERRKRSRHRQARSDILLMAYRTPPIDSPDIVPLGLLSTHLSTGNEARLTKRLVDTGIAVGAHASTGAQPDIFDFMVRLSEKHRAEEALKIIDEEIKLLQGKPISQLDFERARNQELLDLYSGMEANHSFGRFLGEYLMLSGDYMKGFQIIEGYKKTTPADIQRVAKKYFQRKNRSIVIINPPKRRK